MRRIRLLRQQLGSALLEGLISIFLFSIGVISVMALQGVMLRDSGDTRFRAEAAFLADELVGQMWADASNLKDYNTSDSKTSYEPLANWIDRVQALLPNASVDINVNGNDVAINMEWRAGNAISHNYQLDTTITPGGGS